MEAWSERRARARREQRMLVTTAAIAVVCGLLPGVARAQITRPEPLSVAAQIDAEAFTRVTAKGGHEYLGTLTVQPDSALIIGGARLVADSIVRIEVRHKEGDSPLNSVAYVLGSAILVNVFAAGPLPALILLGIPVAYVVDGMMGNEYVWETVYGIETETDAEPATFRQ